MEGGKDERKEKGKKERGMKDKLRGRQMEGKQLLLNFMWNILCSVSFIKLYSSCANVLLYCTPREC